MTKWISMEYPPTGAGGQVWVAYPNPHHPDGWNLRVQWTPLQSEHAVEPLFWCPCDRPDPPPISDATVIRDQATMSCTRCARPTSVGHTIDEQLRAAAARLNERLTDGHLCPACLRVLLRSPEDRAPYLERSY